MHKMQHTYPNTGSINEAGFIANLDRKGFNFSKSLGELYANSIDADCSFINTIITDDYVYIVDDGSGMTVENINSMFDMYRENHSTDQSMGVSGIGAKAALKKISLNTTVYLYTKNKDGEYLYAEIPWNEIVRLKKYSGMIKIGKGEEAQKLYNEFLKNSDTGTIIKITRNDQLNNILVIQFEYSKVIRPCSERFDIIFSEFVDCKFIYKNKNVEKTLEMYRPFGSKSPHKDYYLIFGRDKENTGVGIMKYRVKIYPDDGGLFNFVLQN